VAHDASTTFPPSLMSTSDSPSTAAPSVPLRRNGGGPGHDDTLGGKPPVWSLDAGASAQAPAPPLAARCARHADERRGVCCKELKPADERTLVDPDVIRDAVIGLSVRRAARRATR
jgi:hypothetical protein